MLNPIFDSKRATYLYILVWALIAAMHFSVLFFFIKLTWKCALTDALFSNSSYALLGMSVWYLVKYINVEKTDITNVVINHLSAALILSGLWTAFCFFISDSIFGDEPEIHDFLKRSNAWRYAIGLLYYTVIALIYYLYIYYHRFREKTINELNLQNLVKETKLSYLKSQLNPHFLFNSLNSIASLTITEPDIAYEMILKLSAYLRFTLDQKESRKIPFEEELKNSLYYLEIEKIRFDERLNIKNDISPECNSVLMPNMILQPLYENAVKYSVQESIDTITIETNAYVSDGFLHIIIKNEISADAVVRKGKGIGLKNIKHRLLIIYNRNDLLRLTKTENEYIVKLLIPI